MTLPKAEELELAKPLVERLAKAKARLDKVREKIAKGGEAKASDQRQRAAKKRVKRAQRRLRELRKYAATRQPKPKAEAAGGEAAAAPAS